MGWLSRGFLSVEKFGVQVMRDGVGLAAFALFPLVLFAEHSQFPGVAASVVALDGLNARVDAVEKGIALGGELKVRHGHIKASYGSYAQRV